MSTADELEKLHRLHQKGVLSAAEYEQAKKTVIENEKSVGAKIDEAVSEVIKDVPKYCMFMHLSQFIGIIIPLIGFAVPIVMWQLRKDASKDIQDHGTNIANWIISGLIYFAFTSILFPIVGQGAVIVCAVAFPVVGTLKAKEGKIWTYPLTIQFLKPNSP
jgi:uncharacterized protein